MVARVKALGYAVIETQDVDAWQRFACDLLGLMCASRSADRLLLRMDQYTYRLDVRRSDREGVAALGYDVGCQEDLEALARALRDADFEVTVGSEEEATARQVEALVRFRDPDDNFDVELYWGLRNAPQRFASTTDARFVAGALGLGHSFQVVSDEALYRRLYMDVLGFKLSDYIDFPPSQGVFLHCNPRHHTLAFGVNPKRRLGVGHLMFEVDDLDIVGRAYDHVLDGEFPLYSTLGKHTNDKMVSMYVGSPSGFGIEFGTGGLLIDDETWLPTRYDVAHYWGHERQPENR